mmetsp:Transcript_37589/g.73614  ORF Transcript_37589/g.73614 Transcript_37589/m.73614 type:complete len:90 (+) Transcript_37589:4638-4907(+)
MGVKVTPGATRPLNVRPLSPRGLDTAQTPLRPHTTAQAGRSHPLQQVVGLRAEDAMTVITIATATGTGVTIGEDIGEPPDGGNIATSNS